MRFSVEPGHVMAFRRAIGDTSHGDFPPEPGTAIPPTFVAVDAQFHPDHMRDLRPAGALATAIAGGGNVLHAEQEFEYLAPVLVGQVLTVDERVGRTWSKSGRGGGLLQFREILKEYRDERGATVVRSRMVLVDTAPAGPAAADRTAQDA